ncbi:MAG TPA: UDP-glycosyltransferase, partial [Flavobacteriaceae bacterium]|nr:UDP-glycosyltransferase [Flavobacteriaceae bacterium]
PQFEFYYDAKNIIQKKEFYNRYHLDENKKLICFSGDDIRTSPYDPEYLDHIASAIK